MTVQTTSATAPTVTPEVDAIRHHYEVPNEFYRIVLGPPMMYSGGYWRGGEDLRALHDLAQERKRATGAARVLDIGCGWGTLLDRLTRLHGVARGVGVTLSRTQADYVRGLGNDRVSAHVESWEDHVAAEPYDAAFCVNALEHFVLATLPPPDRVRRFQDFFRQCHRLLRPDGRLVLHVLAVENPPLTRQVLDDLKFLQREEFAGCHIPHLHERAQATEGTFQVVEIRNEPEAFARACRAWLANLADRRDAAVELSRESTGARVERYLAGFAYMLEDGIFDNYRLTLSRRH